MKEVILDTETTGLSVRDGHRIVEIGCIELENLIPTKNRFHCYLNPERKVSDKKEMEKIILCDVPNKIYPDLERIFLNLLTDSGYPGIKFEKKVDFTELYKQRAN